MSEEKWLIGWFKKRNEGVTIAPDTNYIDDGLVDSFGIIELIEEIEGYYKIKFNESIFEDNNIFTIKGLAKIIKNKSNAGT